MKNKEALFLFLILVTFASGIILYPFLPEKMATHWNAAGEANGYSSKAFGVFFMPIMSLFLAILLLSIPKIDPLKENIEKFRKYYDWFMIIMLFFFLYIYLLTLIWNLGIEFDMTKMILPAMGIIFYAGGIMMEKSERNWFIGIRTPWTLSSDRVWDKTHKVGSKLFKLSGILSLIGMFFGKYSIYFIIGPVIFSSIFLFVYSYWEYKKINYGSYRKE